MPRTQHYKGKRQAARSHHIRLEVDDKVYYRTAYGTWTQDKAARETYSFGRGELILRDLKDHGLVTLVPEA